MVSIIITVYQVSKYIQRCLESVINQTYKDVECIIIDDGTQDDSIEKCEKFIKEYNGPIIFKIIHHEINRGLSAARNTGTVAATGDYLFYLDSDDHISSNCIEKLVSYAIEDDSIEMVQGCHIRVCDGNEECRKTGYIRIRSNEDVRKLFYDLHAIRVYVWNKLLKRSFVIENQLYFKEGILYEDELWAFYLMKYLKNACLCDDVTYFYEIRSDSIMTGSDGKKVGESLAIIYNDILNNLTSNKESIELRGNFYTFCKRYLSYLNDAPSLSDTFALYRKCTKQYRCWFVYCVLTVVGIINQFANPLPILQLFYNIRSAYKK